MIASIDSDWFLRLDCINKKYNGLPSLPHKCRYNTRRTIKNTFVNIKLLFSVLRVVTLFHSCSCLKHLLPSYCSYSPPSCCSLYFILHQIFSTPQKIVRKKCAINVLLERKVIIEIFFWALFSLLNCTLTLQGLIFISSQKIIGRIFPSYTS